MTIGMLWLVDKGTVMDSLAEALKYYRRKYGHAANHCVANLKLAESKLEFPIGVSYERWILPGHLWIGVEGQ